MKLRHLIDELNYLKTLKGDEFYENLLNFDFLVRVCNKETLQPLDETKAIGIYLDDVVDECQFIAYFTDKGDIKNEKEVN